ncbi:MAG: type II toxin-antitoxin system PemK/MazF family toxin [Cytophagales bacterium]|nr:type II toxin-antitoxin system PemK/MazF family toxin [Cytophagales bacterium]
MRRGSLVTVAVQGDYGKPRPAVVIQSDNFAEHPSITVLPLTSTLLDTPLVRVTIEPSSENRLTQKSQVMIDKSATLPRGKIGDVIGSLDYVSMQEVDRCLAVFLGIAK